MTSTRSTPAISHTDPTAEMTLCDSEPVAAEWRHRRSA
jgi:hypothetical protein